MTTPSRATSASDSDSAIGTVRATVEIAATPEDVFRALTDPEALAEWWGSDETYRTHDWQLDARPGGAWSVRTTDPSGNDGTVHGEYLAIDAPRTLECTWRASWDGFAPTRLRYELTPATVDGVSGTRLTVTHTGFAGSVACAAAGVTHTLGWTGRLEALAMYLGGRGRFAAPMIPTMIRSTRHRRRLARATA